MFSRRVIYFCDLGSQPLTFIHTDPLLADLYEITIVIVVKRSIYDFVNHCYCLVRKGTENIISYYMMK